MREFYLLLDLIGKENSKGFIQFLVSRNKRTDSKLQDLFKAFLTDDTKELESRLTKNAFNSLKSRLKTGMIEFLKLNHKEENNESLGLINLGLKLVQKGEFGIAFKYFERASEHSRKTGDLNNEFKSVELMLEYAENLTDNQFESLKKRYVELHQSLVNDQRLHTLYTSVKRTFKRAEFYGKSVDVTQLIEKEFSLISNQGGSDLEFKSLYKILEVLDVYGSYSKKYHTINDFFESHIERLENQVDKSNTDIHQLNVYALMSNILFRKRQFEKSIYYCQKLKENLLFYKGDELKHLKRTYNDLYVLNLHFSGDIDGAFNQSLEFEAQTDLDQKYTLSSQLIKAMILFHKGCSHEIPKVLSRFYQSDVFYERINGREKVLYKHFIEILASVEIGDIDFAESRINSVKRKYREDFKMKRYSSALPFLNLVKSIMNNPEILQEDSFRKKVKRSIDWKPFEEEDLFFMCFYAWIKAKLNGKDLYLTTLEIVRSDK